MRENKAKEQPRNKFRLSQLEASVLKLRGSRLPEINGAKTKGIIITRRVGEGFVETLVNATAQSLTHVSDWDFKAWTHPEVNPGMFLSRVLSPLGFVEQSTYQTPPKR